MLKESNKSKNDIRIEEKEVNTMLKESKKSAKPLYKKPGLFRTDCSSVSMYLYYLRTRRNG